MGLGVWCVTCDGTSANLETFENLGCNFRNTYDTMITKFRHPGLSFDLSAVLDPCHMLKLARNSQIILSGFSSKNYTNCSRKRDYNLEIKYPVHTFSTRKQNKSINSNSNIEFLSCSCYRIVEQWEAFATI